MPVSRRFCINKPIVDMLEEQLEALTGDHLRQALRKAIRNIIQLKFPILTKEDALGVTGVGQFIATLIENFLSENPPFPDGVPQQILDAQMQPVPSHSSPRPRRRGRGAGPSMRGRGRRKNSQVTPPLLDNSDSEDPPTLPAAQERSSLRTNSPTRNGKKNRTYIPRVKSAPAALLMALLDGLDDDIDSFIKTELAPRAQVYFDDQMIKKRTGDSNSWHDGWTSMNSQLVSKGLVDKKGRPARFGLTDKGIEIAKLCRRRHLEVENRTLTQYDGEAIGAPRGRPHASNPRTQNLDDEIICVPASSLSSPTRASNFRHASEGSASVRKSQKSRTQSSVPGWSVGEDLPQVSGLQSNGRLSQDQRDHLNAWKLQEEFNQEGHEAATSRMRSSAADGTRRLASGSHEPGRSRETSRWNASRDTNASDELCALSLLRKYDAGEEFGVINNKTAPADGSHIKAPRKPRPLNRPRSSSPSALQQATERRRKISPAQRDRAVRVIERLEKDGNSRQDLIMIADAMLAVGKFPRDDDALFKAMSDTLWAVQQAESKRNDTGPPLELQFTSLNNETDNQLLEDSPDRNQEIEPGLDIHTDWDYLLCDSEPEEPSAPPGLWSNNSKVKEPRAHARKDDSVIDLVDNETNNESPPSDSVVPRATHTKTIENCPVIVLEDSESSMDFQSSKANKRSLMDSKRELRTGEDIIHNPDGLQPSLEKEHKGSSNDEAILILSDEDSDMNYYKEKKSSMRFAGSSQLRVVNSSSPQNGQTKNREESSRMAHVFISDNNRSYALTNEANANRFHKPPEPTDDLQLPKQSELKFSCAHASIPGSVHAELTSLPHVQDENHKDERCQIILILDSVERIGHKVQNCSSFVEMLKVHNIPYDVRQLPCGDALFVARYSDGTDILMDYLIERKTVNDYGESMNDGRISKQSFLLLNSLVSNPILILEGDLKENSYLYNQPRMHSKLAELEVCANVYVKKTKDLPDTVHFYGCILRRLQTKLCGTSKAQVLKGRQLFSDWLGRMQHVKKTMTLEQSFMLQLSQLPGVGINRAQTIISMGYKTPQLLYQAYQQKGTMKEKENMLNQSGSKVGAAVSKSIAQLFNLSSYDL